MARINNLNLGNTPWLKGLRTHEGAPARHISVEQQLTRSVLACMLWEGQFYEDSVAIAGRIHELVAKVPAEKVAALAVEAREKMKLRHAPLLLVREMARLASHRHLVAETLYQVIQRADELSEFVALYWSEGKQPLSAQVKKGLAAAFTKFDEYALAKYNRATPVKLRDVLFLAHAKPVDDTQAELWKRLVEGHLATPDTWEVALSAGADKRQAWERLLAENKLGSLALLRNLRNMAEAKVSEQAIREGLAKMKTERVLPSASSLPRVTRPSGRRSWRRRCCERCKVKPERARPGCQGTPCSWSISPARWMRRSPAVRRCAAMMQHTAWLCCCARSPSR
jgi:hypothetical protein